MHNLWSTAERLREVQSAQRRFMTLWAIDQAHRLLDMQFRANRAAILGQGDDDLAPPDWSGLYRGSVLDD